MGNNFCHDREHNASQSTKGGQNSGPAATPDDTPYQKPQEIRNDESNDNTYKIEANSPTRALKTFLAHNRKRENVKNSV